MDIEDIIKKALEAEEMEQQDKQRIKDAVLALVPVDYKGKSYSCYAIPCQVIDEELHLNLKTGELESKDQ